MNTVDVFSPPALTNDLPGVGGRIKASPEDFLVEEIPAYLPSGDGDFLYLWVEKRDMGAEFFVRQVARALEIPVGEVGSAGLKDRRAVTRQWISVPAPCEPRLSALDSVGVKVLQTGRHTNKLRAGHLRGNRFDILLRGARTDAALLSTIVERLSKNGFPNYYGLQRFGRGGETLTLGVHLLRGERGRRVNPFLKKLALSAVQSAVFNIYLANRLRDGLMHAVLLGDVLAKLPAGGMFTCTEPEVDQLRFDRREIVPAGPIVGKKTFPARAVAAEREAASVASAGFSLSDFASHGKLLMGTRRHNLIFPEGLSADVEGPESVRIRVELPAGCYATVLLGEIAKCEIADGDEAMTPSGDSAQIADNPE